LNPTQDLAPHRVALRDGRSVMLRSVRADDAEGMQAAIVHLSEDARYTRFMAPLRELSPAMLERAVRPVAGRDLALVAVAGDGADDVIVGGARYIGLDDGSCEFAVTIIDAWQGAGLASNLMKELIRDARARGLKRMDGYVLASNRPMLALAQRLGFRVGPSEEGPSVKLVRLKLAHD
jgi:RimJ/RimL family protein N-acetyltransferase